MPKAAWFGKCLCSPCILIVQSFWVFVVGALLVYVYRILGGVGCALCLCCGCCFKDKKFPRRATSIGAWKGKTLDAIESSVRWERIGDVVAGKRAKLFSGKIEPGDIKQGDLGDCWLLSALACISNTPGAIQNVFETIEYSAYGRYVLRIYSGAQEKWTRVVVDDWVPVDKTTGRPLFAQPNGDEAWVMLIEKAVAKMCGSYAGIDGGSILWALQALTGDHVFKFEAEGDGWTRFDLVHLPENGTRACGLRKTAEHVPDVDMFDLVWKYSKQTALIGASSGSGQDSQNVEGIVQGHAYSIVKMKSVSGKKMVQLRNPWGRFEWQGRWCDGSALWQQNPKVMKACKQEESNDDGKFWMEWVDFRRHFKSLSFCDRSYGVADVRLDINEDRACCGPCCGMLSGCWGFWCCCGGPRALLLSRESRHKTQAAKRRTHLLGSAMDKAGF